MSPGIPNLDSEREVANYARRVAKARDKSWLRRFKRGPGIERILDEGGELYLRLEAECRRVEREIASLSRRPGDPGVVGKTQTLTRELHAGRCQLLRLLMVIDELRPMTVARSASTNGADAA